MLLAARRETTNKTLSWENQAGRVHRSLALCLHRMFWKISIELGKDFHQKVQKIIIRSDIASGWASRLHWYANGLTALDKWQQRRGKRIPENCVGISWTKCSTDCQSWNVFISQPAWFLVGYRERQDTCTQSITWRKCSLRQSVGSWRKLENLPPPAPPPHHNVKFTFQYQPNKPANSYITN